MFTKRGRNVNIMFEKSIPKDTLRVLEQTNQPSASNWLSVLLPLQEYGFVLKRHNNRIMKTFSPLIYTIYVWVQNVPLSTKISPRKLRTKQVTIDPFTVKIASWVIRTSSTDMGQILHSLAHYLNGYPVYFVKVWSWEIIAIISALRHYLTLIVYLNQ